MTLSHHAAGRGITDEYLLQYIWKIRALAHISYIASTGENVSIIAPGDENIHSGPDFINAKIQIGHTIWAGCVEIHIRASDWNRHGHQHDASYDNVVLHVVYDNDMQVYNSKGQVVPTIAWKSVLNEQQYEQYAYYKQNAEEIICLQSAHRVESLQLYSWMDMLLVERLENRMVDIEQQLKQQNARHEEVFYHMIAKAFGFKINALPMLITAQSLPLLYLARQKNQLLHIEALLYGQAGMLQGTFADEYPRQLQQEYAILQRKYGLKSMCSSSMWKYAKMYPGGFPTIRLSQLAALIYHSSSLLSKALEADSVHVLANMLTVSASSYWNTHYRFDVPTRSASVKRMGSQAVYSIIINTVLPYMYAYAVWHEQVELKHRVVHFYENLPIEQNIIVRKYKHLEPMIHNALHSQALIEMYEHYCTKKQCNKCAIGLYLLKV